MSCADPAPARLRLLREQAEEALDPVRPLEQHEEGHEDDRHEVATSAVITPFVTATACPRARTAASAPPLFERLLRLLDEVVLRLQEAEPPAALRDVVRGSPARCSTKSFTWSTSVGMKGGDAGEREQRSRRGERDRDAAPLHPCRWNQSTAGLSASDEEERDQDPRDHGRTIQITHRQTHDGDRDAEHRQDRPHGEAHDALGRHGGEDRGRAGRFDRAAAGEPSAVSLRGQPAEATATLPDGREALVRVSVPDDSYVPKREREHRHRRDRDRRARSSRSVDTILEPEQDSEGLALAREIASGLGSGRSGRPRRRSSRSPTAPER